MWMVFFMFPCDRSRTKNMMWYGVLGTKELLQRTYKNLEQKVQLEVREDRAYKLRYILIHRLQWTNDSNDVYVSPSQCIGLVLYIESVGNWSSSMACWKKLFLCVCVCDGFLSVMDSTSRSPVSRALLCWTSPATREEPTSGAGPKRMM